MIMIRILEFGIRIRDWGLDLGLRSVITICDCELWIWMKNWDRGM